MRDPAPSPVPIAPLCAAPQLTTTVLFALCVTLMRGAQAGASVRPPSCTSPKCAARPPQTASRRNVRIAAAAVAAWPVRRSHAPVTRRIHQGAGSYSGRTSGGSLARSARHRCRVEGCPPWSVGGGADAARRDKSRVGGISTRTYVTPDPDGPSTGECANSALLGPRTYGPASLVRVYTCARAGASDHARRRDRFENSGLRRIWSDAASYPGLERAAGTVCCGALPSFGRGQGGTERWI